MSNNVPVLMLRGEDGKFFPVDGITGGGGSGGGTGGSTTAEKVAYTNENLKDVTTVKEALDVTFEYIGNKIDKKPSLSDITPEAIGAKAVSTKVDTGTLLSMNDNTEYRLTNVTTLTLYAPYQQAQYECWFRLTFANTGTIAVSFPTGMKYIGSAPDFNNGESWEISVKDGVVIAQKIGDGT